jgi:hypothetical protein
VAGGALSYLCNVELVYGIGRITAHATARWDLAAPPGGADASRAVAHGTRADVVLEQSAHTGHRRRLVVAPRTEPAAVERALTQTVAAWQAEAPGVAVAAAGPAGHEVTIPAALDAGHESHFTRVLDDFLGAIDERRWPAALSARTLAKYTFLAEVAAKTGAERAGPA